MKIKKELMQKIKSNFKLVFNDYLPVEAGKKVELLDSIYLYRILLNRMPGEDEIIYYTKSKYTYRDMLKAILDSDEYQTNFYNFLPPGFLFMTERNGYRFWFDTRDREMGVLMAIGKYEPEATSLLEKLLKPGMQCLDIGAQTGYYSLLMARCISEDGRVLAYEPMERSYAILRKNITENKAEKIITTFNVACGAKKEKLSMRTVSNMYVADVNGDLHIDCIALDDEIDIKVDFVKIDAEGHEPQVFEGMKKTIEKNRPVIITEINAYWLSQAGSSFSGYAELLEGMDYKLFDIDRNLSPLNKQEDDPLRNSNVLAIPDEKVELRNSLL